MKFATIPKATYYIGQELIVLGRKCRVDSYTHTGNNIVVNTIDDGPRQRIVCIVSDDPPIAEVRA